MSELVPTGLDRKYEPPKLKRIIAISFSNLFWIVIFTAQARFQIYATKVLGLDPFLIALFIAIFVIWDIVNDPLIGRKSDKTKRLTRRYGKRLPLIILANIGMAVFLILQFLPWPIKEGGGLADEDLIIPALIWLTLMICLFDFFQTFREMNLEASLTDLMRDQESRRRIALFDAFTINLIGMVLGLLLVPLLLSSFHAFDETGRAENPNAFFMMGVVVALIYAIGLPLAIYGLREPKEMREFRAEFDEIVERPPFKEVIKRAFKDKNWLAFMIVDLQWAIINRTFITGLDYYVVDGLGMDISFAIIPQIAVVLGLVIFGVVAYFTMKKWGTRKTTLLGIAITSIGFFLCVFSTDIWSLTLFYLIGAAGVGLQVNARSVVLKQALDDSVLKHGTREEGQYNSINGMLRSTNLAIQALAFAVIWAIFGYDPLLGTENTDLAKFGLLFTISVFLGIVSLLAGIAFWKLFDITKEREEEIKEHLLKLGR
jgi:Na+/melibiose symporter-like transporter